MFVPVFNIIEKDMIAKINAHILGKSYSEIDLQRARKSESCFSSFYYYESKEEQITSIVLSIIKNHYFVDGNKRTAFVVYILLAKINNLTFITNKEDQVRIFESIPTLDYDIYTITKILFPQF